MKTASLYDTRTDTPECPLIDNEFDEEASIEEPEKVLFLLTDDPLHFNLGERHE